LEGQREGGDRGRREDIGTAKTESIGDRGYRRIRMGVRGARWCGHGLGEPVRGWGVLRSGEE
jgi:hypothetical protein